MLEEGSALEVREQQNQQTVGYIALNGYHIEAGRLVGRQGKMHSFRIVRGKLPAFVPFWSGQKTLWLCGGHGETVPVRIAAMPVDAQSYGLLEFV